MQARTFSFVLAVALLAAAPSAFAASPSRPWVSGFHLGLRLGAYEPSNAQRSYDAVYGGPIYQGGVAVELLLRRRAFLALAMDYGEVSGHQVLLTSPPQSTGIGTTLTLAPVHLTVGWIVAAEKPWHLLVGGGPSYLFWRDTYLGGSDSGSTSGGHLLVALEHPLRHWNLGGEVRWSTFPNAVGKGGVSGYYGEDDLGGFGVAFRAYYRLR